MSEEGLSRRDFVRATGGAATVAATGAGVAGTTSAQEEPEYPEYLTSGNLVDKGYEDLRGQSEVTVAVGPGGDFAFGPTLIQINPGTKVVFQWESDNHNVVPESIPDGASWSGYEDLKNSGFSYENTFETLGTYTYFCRPHEASGMKGGIIVAEGEPAGGGSEEQGPIAWPGYISNAAGDSEEDARGQSEVTVQVGSGSSGYQFSPTRLRIDPGTKVTFEWVSLGHNVVAQSQPEGAGWEGYEDIENTGFTYSHTFENEGMYAYYCGPHESQGMKGAIAVGSSIPREAITEPALPQEAKTLLVATMGAMGTTLGLAYFFLKHGGNDTPDPSRTAD
jgi:halocyanin-like protein